VPVAKRIEQPLDDEPGICDHCRQIDFQKVSNLSLQDLQSLKNVKGILIADLGTRYNSPLTNGCPVCKVLHVSRVKRKQFNEHYQLLAYSYLLVYYGCMKMILIPRGRFSIKAPTNIRETGDSQMLSYCRHGRGRDGRARFVSHLKNIWTPTCMVSALNLHRALATR